ncbi:uncharacterized protein LOC141663737 isoform X2 [Apium graveolens]|uniref:uncharacterized protein LOC141663737 isoform X2 n=1 Tax=Apium graveolens TaxID=4045 RepID=UPI003D78BBEF
MNLKFCSLFLVVTGNNFCPSLWRVGWMEKKHISVYSHEGSLNLHNITTLLQFFATKDLSIWKYTSRFQNQKNIAARREKLMKAMMALDDFIEEKMRHFHARYSRGPEAQVQSIGIYSEERA